MPMNWLRDLRGKPANQQGRAPAPVTAPAGHAAPGPDDPPAVWVEAVCNASDKALATAWAARVEGEECLAEIATRCRFAEIRFAAAQRISDVAALQRVAEASRDKDKHLYRHCTDVLRAHRKGSERARRAPELEDALRALLDATPLAISHLLQIEKDIAALGADGSELARCVDLLAQAHARVLAETQAQIDLRERLAAAQSLLAEITAQPAAGRLDQWRERADSISLGAAAPPAWLARLPAARALATALEQIAARLAGLAAELEHAAQEAQRAVALEAERAAAQEAQRAAAQEAPPATQAPPADAPREVALPHGANKRIDRAVLEPLVDELERHLEEGRLAEADASASRIDQALDGTALPGQLARRLQRARAQQARLVGWARWGTDQAREQLIGVAEALLRGEPDLDERARAVPLLRTEWKRLDVHGQPSQALWKRFDAALVRAYKPVAERRAAEAVRQSAARAAKNALCDRWEAWHAELSAHPPDYKALAAKRAEIAAEWRTAAKADFRDERRLRRRLDALLAKIDAQLEEAHGGEVARRQQLVDSAEALRDAADLAQALSAAKSLQRRWKEDTRAVQLRHGEDQKLWQRFRAACDAVFARRDAAQAAQSAQREEREQAHRAILGEFEAGLAAAAAAGDAGALQKNLVQFRAAWTEDRRAAAGEDVERRARDLMRRAQQKIESLQKEKHAARFAQMGQKAQSAAAGASAEELARGHAARDSLLLDLEIALELPTPQAHADARRARSLSRLQDRFRAGAPAAGDPEDLIRQWYAIVAATDAQQADRMAAVVRRLLQREPGGAGSGGERPRR